MVIDQNNRKEWCKVGILDRDVPEDCYGQYVQAEDLKKVEECVCDKIRRPYKEC